MSDVVWVAFISASGVIVAALMTQILVMRNATKQAERATQQEALQWQRSEAHRKQKESEENLQNFWRAIVETQDRLVDGLHSDSKWNRFSEGAISTAATRAYSIALVLIPNLRQSAKDYCHACAEADAALLEDQRSDRTNIASAWRRSFDLIEAAVIAEAARIGQIDIANSASPPNK